MPSLINELILEEVKGVVEDSENLIVLDPAGLKAEESLGLRKELFEIGAVFKVAKARVIRRAFDEDAQSMFAGKGTVGLVGASDIAAAAKVIDKLAKDEKVRLRGGLVDGRPLDAKAAAKLATLPSKQELQAKLLGTLQAPMSNFVRLLNEVPGQFVRVLAAYKDKQDDAA